MGLYYTMVMISLYSSLDIKRRVSTGNMMSISVIPGNWTLKEDSVQVIGHQ